MAPEHSGYSQEIRRAPRPGGAPGNSSLNGGFQAVGIKLARNLNPPQCPSPQSHTPPPDPKLVKTSVGKGEGAGSMLSVGKVSNTEGQGPVWVGRLSTL